MNISIEREHRKHASYVGHKKGRLQSYRLICITLACLLHISLAVASTYNLRVEVTPIGSGTLNTSGGTYEESSNVRLRTYVNTGYVFKGWYEGDKLLSSSTSFNYTMPASDVLVQARYEYNPTVPDNPAMPDTTTYYTFTAIVSPTGAGTLNTYSGKYAANEKISLRAYENTGYQFVGWMDEEGTIISSSTSFNYTMPRRASQLSALYTYNPAVPANPDSMATNYTVTIACKPTGSGTFNTNSVKQEEGSNVRLYAYTNTGYKFLHWENEDGEAISTAQNFYYVIPHGDSKIYGVFEYDPDVPENPNKNNWNKNTGEMIVDDFKPGNLNNAIYNALNKSNSSSNDVTMITVAGQMSSNDFGIANNYNNCTLLDLSRTYGYTDVPSYAYDYNSSLQHIILPACVENIGYRAFDQCSNLSEVTCYAITPPTVDSYAFRNIAEGAVLHVLSTAIPLYAEAEGWKDFTILPLTEEVRTLKVNLPAGSEDGRYKNMTIELVNAETGHKQKYVISDRVNYTFSGLLKKSLFNIYVRNSLGFVLGQIENIAIADEDVSITFESLMQPQEVTLRVLTSENNDVTNQVQTTWFDAAGSYLTRGNAIKGVTEGTALTIRVALPQTLGMAYVVPTDTVYTVQASDNKLNVVLNPLPQVTISGTVKDVTTGNTISNAVVSVSQMLNGKYSKAFTTKTDDKGAYSLTVYDAPSAITYSASDYISQTVNYEDFSASSQLEEVALKSITGATITTSFTYRTSVEEGATPDIQNWYSDYANVAYSIYNKTQQKPINDFSVQYPSIVLLEEVAEGDELVLTATSKNGAFVPVEATAVIDASNRAEAIFDIVALGGIKASFTSTDNAAVVAILYNAGGQLVKKYNYSSATININELQDGKYTLVSMGSSTLFNSIYNLSQLVSTGLKEGTDYVKNTITVESGLIATISNDLIPTLDESKLYYTGDNTMFSVNKTSVTAGNYLTLKGKIDFKNVYASKVSNVSMVIDLPESAEFVENSVMVGTSISSYTLDGNRLTIPLERYTDQVRFCIIPTTGGDYAPNAFAQFTIDGKEVLQPIGSAHYIVESMTLYAPDKTANKSVVFKGGTFSDSQIKIYDNGVLIGETRSLANGNWSIKCELYEPREYSKHIVYAQITTPQNVRIETERKNIIYDVNFVYPTKVTMFNYYNEVKIDLINPTSELLGYTFVPSQNDFSFVVDFSKSGTETLYSDVIVNVTTSDATVVPIHTMFDRKKNSWIGTGKFNSNNLPVGLDVFCVENEEGTVKLDYSLVSEYTEALLEIPEISLDTINETFSLKVDTIENSISKESGGVFTREFYYTDFYNPTKSFRLKQSLLIEFIDKEEINVENFIKIQLTNGDFYYLRYIINDMFVAVECIDTQNSIKITEKYYDYSVAVYTRSALGTGAAIVGGIAAVTGIFVGAPVVAIIGIGAGVVGLVDTGYWHFQANNSFNAHKECLESKNLAGKYKEKLENSSYWGYGSGVIGLGVGGFGVKFAKALNASGVAFGIASLGSTAGGLFGADSFDKIKNDIEKECGDPNPRKESPNKMKPYIDPSGYVYEGVSSNRVEGVMASCYYKETIEDMYGDLHENIVLWDATEYAQQNPLFTDENGMYAWDVPQGLWQVKFEKEGYETTYSDWLPVPPPQLEVNIGIKQSTQPEVKAARAYEDGIEMEFSKYMQPDLLNTENIFVTKNGETATGSVKLLNEEQSYEGQAETYASKVRFVPDTAFLTTDEVVLTVSRKVKSYAGIPMQEDYTQEFDIEKEVKSLVADSIIKVPYGGTIQMTISALPYDAAIGKTLIVKSSSSMIATVDTDTLVMDENGQATVTLTGELPGTSVVTFSLADADVNGMSTVQVAIIEEKVTENPTASRVSGTALYRGTKVVLNCKTEGAVIYYTLDGSCPCDEATQIMYKEPIVITEDSVVIKAMAVADDMYESDVVEFHYTLKRTTLGLSLNEGWNWVSHNVEAPVAATELEKNAVRIVSQTEELVKDPTYGLIGNLDSISPIESYKVQVSENTEYTLTGYEYNAAAPIRISSGWNWLGYPVNQVMSINEAFANATPAEGDYIVGQDGFALYNEGAWAGTLLTLSPGSGYMYQATTDYELTYNTAIVSKAKALFGKGIANETPWTADKHKYPKVMCVIADLYVGNVLTEDYYVGAFCGTECRGVGKYADGKLMISIYGNGGEKITFVAMDNETEKTFSVTEEVVFAETLLGGMKQAYALHVGKPTNVQNAFGGWNVRIEKNNLYLTAKDKIFDYVTLTDVYGNVVLVAEDVAHNEAISLAALSDGVYIITAKQDGIMYYKKIMKAGE